MDIKDFMEKSRNSDLVLRFEEGIEAYRKLMKETGASLALINRPFLDSAILTADNLNYSLTTLKDSAASRSLSAAIQFANIANESISKLSITSSIQEMLSEHSKITSDWKRIIESVIDYRPLNILEPAIKDIQAQIARISEISLMGEKSLFGVNQNNIASLLGSSTILKNSIFNNNLSFIESYKSLFESLAEPKINYLTIPQSISVLPPIEYYRNNRLFETLSIKRKETPEEVRFSNELQAEDEIETSLKILNPSFINMWRGSLASLKPDNPDSIRHFSTSLRELLTSIIHTLAPDDAVKAWTKEPKHFHNNRPTRRARLLYIYRNLNFLPFEDFVEKDIDAFLACNDLFQEGTHSIESKYSKPMLRELRNRAGSIIRFLIKTSEDSKDN